MEKIIFNSFMVILSCQFSGGQKSVRGVEPVCGRSTDLQLMYNFIKEEFSLKQEVQALKETVENLQTKLLRLENDVREEHRYQYIPGPSVNIAKDYKTVAQSSDWHSPRYPPELAIDSNTKTFSHTAIEANPWWSMEFCNDVLIAKVTLRKRPGCCSDQMSNIVVTVDGMPCGRFDGTIGVGDSIDIICPKPLVGKVLKIQSMQWGILAISELEVFSSYR